MQAKPSLLLATFLLVSLSAAFAKPPEPQPEEDIFLGLWEGVWAPTSDLRGLEAIRSITVNDDETYTIYGDWSDHNGCVLRGTGIIVDDVLVVDDMTQFCTTSTNSAPTTYTFDETNGVLREELYYAPDGQKIHTILHKTSR